MSATTNPAPTLQPADLEGIQTQLSSLGLDLLSSAPTSHYNASVAAPYHLPSDAPGARMLVIGNSRALWPQFISALARNPAAVHGDAPLDSYVEAAVHAVFGVGGDVRFAHEVGDGRRFCARAAAAAAGLGAVDGESQLLVHHTYGPWVSVRAVVLLGRDGECGGSEGYAVSREEMASSVCEEGGSGGGGEGWRELVAIRDTIGVELGERHPFRHY
jgi:hypothetical protein